MKRSKRLYRLLGGIMAGLLVAIIFGIAANFEYTRAVESKKERFPTP